MGKYYLGHLCYNGSKFYGWQRQKDQRTVQQNIYDVIRELYEFGRIDVKATSRTDRGVHSFGQVVKMLIPRKEDPGFMLNKLNEAFPADLYLSDLVRINPSFRVTHLAKNKEYLYFFSPQKLALPHSFVGYNNSQEELNIAAMALVCKRFVGVHDFSHFQHRSDAKGSKVREIISCSISSAHEVFPHFFTSDAPVYCLRIRGKGFLKQMVRIIMGTLLNVASGSLTENDVVDVLSLKRDDKLGFIAPAAGLFLYDIVFPELDKGNLKEIVDSRSYITKDPQFTLWQNEGEMSFPLFPDY